MYRRNTTLALLLLLVGCGGGGASTIPVPDEPEAAIRGFMEAVRGNDLNVMAGLWGSSRGLALNYMDGQELRQRLTVIQVYLDHESYEIVPPGLTAPGTDKAREFSVRITRKGCRPTIPFTLVQYQRSRSPSCSTVRDGSFPRSIWPQPGIPRAPV
jgi:hypothetical protein